MKAGLSVAEKLNKMRVIPNTMLPSTLKHKLVLPNIVEIRLDYSRSAKEFGPMFQFYRLYVADLRFHNPDLTIHRNVTDEGPLVGKVVIRGKNTPEGEEIVIEGIKMKTPEELKEKIIQINSELL